LNEGQFITPLIELDRVSSTQDAAREIVRAGSIGIVGVRAKFQSQGRGRTGSKWQAPANQCLLVTYAVPLEAGPASSGMLALAAGVAVADAIDDLTALSAGLKWPNDVLLSGRKAAGILIETERDRCRNWWALVGVGMNVNVRRFPKELADKATSLLMIAGTKFDMSEVEATVRFRIASAARLVADKGPDPILQAWRERDQTRGMKFRAASGNRSLIGTAIGIADSGALILQTDDGSRAEVFSASSVS